MIAQRPTAALLLATMLAIPIATTGCESNSYLRMVGHNALNDGDLDRAESALRQAVGQDPTDWLAHYRLGLVMLGKDKPLDAQLSLEHALELRHNQPQTPRILDALAEALYRQGDRDRLIVVLDNACDNYGTSADFMRQGKYLALTGDADGAALAYRKAARFAKPGNPDAYLAMADLFESLGDRTRAIDSLHDAYRTAPKNREVDKRLRGYDIVPGPTMVEAMPKTP